jgi:uncharacterized membrane protein
VLLTLVFFNCFNIFYSFGIYYKFSVGGFDKLSMIASIMSLAALVLMLFLIVFASRNGFGEFKEKFKRGFI